MAHNCGNGPVCTIIPAYLLQNIVDSESATENQRTCAARTIARTHAIRTAFHAPGAAPQQPSIVPNYMHQAIIDSPETSVEEKERAQKNIAAAAALRPSRAPRLMRTIYDCEQTSQLPGNQVRRESEVAVQDVSTNEVYDFFGTTFEFYSQVFKRNSVDGNGLTLKGSVHYDDEEPPPGFNNAFWTETGNQMIFGDGDGELFTNFTRSLDVIAHELTHGITQFSSGLPYHLQSGALNESLSDVFGVMTKQWFLKQEAKDADWLVGAEIFTPAVQGDALRSMKAPGTAYNDPRFGKDRQVGHMKDYIHLADTDRPRDDRGGVHTNSGIPNKAFYLVATRLQEAGKGAHSWDVAGPIWYKTQMDPELRQFARPKANWDKCFKVFADITIAHAAELGQDVADIVKQAWEDVGYSLFP
jgi:Zn-dependent metalloprotease